MDEIQLVGEVGRRLKARQAIIVDSMSAFMTADIADLDEDPQLRAMLYASVEGNIHTILQILINDIPLEHLQPPIAAVEYAIRLAQRGVPSNALRRAYHVGQNNLMNDYFAEVQDLDCSPELKLRVLHRLTTVAGGYIDWITRYVLQAYDDERQRWIAARGNVHSSLIHAIISGTTDTVEPFTLETGYALDQFHIGVIVWTTEPEPDAETLMGLEQLVRRLAAAPAPPIFTAVDRSTGWAWLPRGRSDQVLDDAARALVAGTAGARIAFGLPAAGLAGFRRSHQQAAAARFVALAADGRLDTSYGDPGVAVVSVLARDPDTRSWVGEVLGELARDTPNNERLRRTLRVFLSTGGSFAQAAERLNLHRNSVKYRVDRAIELRGRPLGADRLDVELALQACHFLGTAVLQAG